MAELDFNTAVVKAANAYLTGISGTTYGQVQGVAADNAAVAGNPVLLAGKYNASLQTYDDGDAATIQTNSRGYLRVVVHGTDNSVSRITSSAASTNATSAKASPGTLKKIFGYNASGSVKYIKIYNKASSPTVGTDTPVLTLAIPGLAAFAFDMDHFFTTGIAYAITGANGDADTTAVAAGDILGLNVVYV